jgi:hypothetical protein
MSVHVSYELQMPRSFSSEVATTTSKPSRGGGLLSRISSFFVGAGFTALATQFYIVQEIRDGNKQMITKQRDLEQRLAKLEK